MKIKCENPTILFNPHLKYLMSSKCHTLYLSGNYFTVRRGCYFNMPWRDLYAAKQIANADNLDDFYMLDEDGVVYPIFMAVPCGHCILCRARKTEDWKIRCMCESYMHRYRPLFITLTFDPLARPTDMKECYVQFRNFMKRLRINVERDLGIKGELRYVAVSEWTPQHHYPHIHMILWGMPYVPCAEGDKNSYQTLIKYIQDDCWKQGYCKVEFARDPSCAYPLKYMRKGMEKDCWFTASRRHGIGYDYCMSQLLSFVSRCPDATSFVLPVTKYNKLGEATTTVKTCGFPAYFKRLLFPTLSCLVPSSISVGVREFQEAAVHLMYFYSTVCPHRSDLLYDVEYLYDKVAEKYSLFPLDWSIKSPSHKVCKEIDRYAKYLDGKDKLRCCDTRSFADVTVTRITDGVLDPHRIESCISSGVDGIRYVSVEPILSPFEVFDFLYGMVTYGIKFERLYDVLMNFDFNQDYVKSRLAFTNAHKDEIRLKLLDMPDVDIQKCLDAERRDQEWIQTHWMNKEIG